MKKLLKTHLKKLKSSFLLRVMKVQLILFLIGVMGNMLHAENAFSQTTISLKLNNIDVETLFSVIESKTEYVILYKESSRIKKKVTVDVKNKKLETVLNETLAPLGLKYHLTGKQIIVTEHDEVVETKQSIKVTGVVLDKQNDDVLIGASIKVKGLDTGTITDVNGRFSIDVPYAEAVLVVSYIGFQPLEYPLKGKREIVIELIEDSKALEEVIVVGYTKQRKETLVGAVASITTKDLAQSPTANINNALAGRLPGLIANQFSGGEPGVDKAEVFVRGKSTFNDQSPIVIIDGVERDMSYLSSEEIETFTILKDASATAQYGVRGANGVVVITTKRGQANERATVSFKASVGMNEAVKFPSYLGSADYAMLYNEAMINDAKRDGTDISTLNLFNDDAIQAFRNGEGYNWDYFDYAFKPALQQDYSLSIRGGNEKISYFVMAGYFSQGTNFDHADKKYTGKESKFDRYNVRSNIDIKITKNFWARFDLGGRITDRTTPGTSAGNITKIANTQPSYLPIVLEPTEDSRNDNYFADNPNGLLFANEVFRYNILGELSRTGYQNERNTDFEGSLTLGHNLDFILPGLKIEGTMSYDFHGNRWLRRDVEYYSEGYRQYPGYATFEPIEGNRSDSYMDPTKPYTGLYGGGNKYGIDQNKRDNLSNSDQETKVYMQFKVDYSKTFNKVHEVSAMLLGNRSERTKGKDPYWRYQGLTGRATYYYDRKYLAEFNFGYNGSENFARGKRYGFFPAGSLGWVVSNEEFMESTQNWLDYLKIRASYGLVGNDKMPSRRFAYLSLFTGGDSYRFGPNDFQNEIGGIREGDLGNLAISWEKAKKLNIGIDFTVLNQRLTVAADFFYEKRYDILTNLSTKSTDIIQRVNWPSIVGKSAPYLNSSEVENRGIDLEVSWMDKIGKHFRYWIRPNFTFARNKIKYTNEINWGDNTWRQATGRSMDLNYCYVFDHFVADEAEAIALNEKGTQGAFGKLIPGDVVYKDLNDDGTIDQKDRMAMGYPRSPEIMFGIPIGFQYKNIDFSVLFQGAANSSLLLKDAAVFDFPSFDQDKIGKVKPLHLNRWTPETAATAKYPALHMGTHSNNKNPDSSLFLYDGKYLRLKNIEIGYSLPHKIIKIANLQQVRFYVQGQNLLTWDKLGDVDVDPESNSDGSWYPVQRTYNFGVNVTF